jgi:ADP-ribose pyrophosphatase YjhB (NUDIX family)
MPPKLWGQVKRYMPIPCVDVIVENSRGMVLLGWRRILPHRNVWALPGGRIFKGEPLEKAAKRILSGYGVDVGGLCLVGVFPIGFKSRSDVSICVSGKIARGNPIPDDKEFTRLQWMNKIPVRTGANYKKMIERWRKMKKQPTLKRFNQL